MINTIVRNINGIAAIFGINVVKLFHAVCGIPRFVRHLIQYRKIVKAGDFKANLLGLKPVLDEFFESAGTASGHYFHQDLWAARKIFHIRPKRHIDIGSRIDGFIAHVLTFMDVEVIDIRPLESRVEGLSFVHEDATYLKGIADNTVESLSCLHAVEHFGLGRYSDPVASDSYIMALRSMSRVLARGGRLYVSVPIGKRRLEFNAHRIFSPLDIPNILSELKLVSSAFVADDGELVLDVSLSTQDNARFACGLYEFTKS